MLLLLLLRMRRRKETTLIFLWTIWNTKKEHFNENKPGETKEISSIRKTAFLGQAEKAVFWFFFFPNLFSLLWAFFIEKKTIKNTSIGGYILDIMLVHFHVGILKKAIFHLHQRNGTETFFEQRISFLKSGIEEKFLLNERSRKYLDIDQYSVTMQVVLRLISSSSKYKDF